MLGSHNILSPASGGPIAVPSQDMVLGIYYLTKMGTDKKGEGKTFADTDEVVVAFDQGKIYVHAKRNVRIPQKVDGENHGNEMIKTTTERAIFNKILPDVPEYLTKTLGTTELRTL